MCPGALYNKNKSLRAKLFLGATADAKANHFKLTPEAHDPLFY
jgi:hypothetical protein